MWTEQETKRWERNLMAMANSAGTGDPEAFAELVRLAKWLNEDLLPFAYDGLRDQGYSTREIARPLNCTHQAAHARFRRKP